MEIRKTEESDIPKVMQIYAHARKFMQDTGNPNQWGPTLWPPEKLIRDDVKSQNSYVCVHNGEVVAVFYFAFGKSIDPCYSKIYDGAWHGDEYYGVVHRIASSGTVKGAGRFCIEWAYKMCGHLRIDTHGDNKIMQSLLLKLGFIYTGIIYVKEDNYPRLAFEKLPD